MLLVQNVPDDKLAERAMVQDAMAAFLQSGGKIQRIGITERDAPGLFGGEQHRSRATAKARAQLEAKMKANMPEIIRKHRRGATLNALAKAYRTSQPALKRYLLAAGEDPTANVKNPAVSFDQVLVIKEMVEGGASRADIEKWTGVPAAKVLQTIADYEFKYLGG